MKLENLQNKLKVYETKINTLLSTAKPYKKLPIDKISKLQGQIQKQYEKILSLKNKEIAKLDKEVAKKIKKQKLQKMKEFITELNNTRKEANKSLTKQNRKANYLLKSIKKINPNFVLKSREYVVSAKFYRKVEDDEDIIENKYHTETDLHGNMYIYINMQPFIYIKDSSIKNFNVNKFYNVMDNKTSFDNLIKVLEKDETVKDSLNYLRQSKSIDGVTITNIDVVDNEYVEPKFLDKKYHNDNDNKAIFNYYIEYKINPKATDFKDLIYQEKNDYLKKHFRKNSCLLTAIINKFYKRFEERKSNGKRCYSELTYDFLCKFLNIENKPSNIGCTIREVLPFFERYRLGLFVYSQYMKLIFKYEPEIKNNRYAVLRIIIKDDHIYELNKNLKSLEQMVDVSDDVRPELHVNDKYNIMDFSEDEIKIHFIDNVDDILNTVKLYKDEKDKIRLKLITNTVIQDIVLQLINKGYTPKPYFNDNNMYKVNIEVGHLFISVENADITSQSEVLLTVSNIEEYKKFQEVNNKFYGEIIKSEYLSYNHDSVLEIENKYKINPILGYFEYNKNAVKGLDERKAYTECLLSMNKVPVFKYFDIYEKYNNEEIEDYNYYIVECLDESEENAIIFSEKVSRMFGFVLKNIDFSYKIHYVRKPFKIENVDFNPPVKELYSNPNISMKLKKYIANKTMGMLEKKKNIAYDTRFFDDKNIAKYYQIKYDGKMFPLVKQHWEEVEEYDYIDDKISTKYHHIIDAKCYVVSVSKEKELVNGLNAMKDIIYCKQKLKLYNQYKILSNLKIKVIGIKTDCIFYEGDDNVIYKNFNMKDDIGGFRIETGKYMVDKKIEVRMNDLIEIKNKIEIKTFNNEYDVNEINQYLSQNKNLMIKSLFAGCGKSQSVKNFGKKTLFILPENTLCRDIKKDGFDSITFSKLFGLYADDIELKNRKEVNVDDYEVICFDEIAKHSIDRLKRISEFIKNNPEKWIFGAGDCNQINPIGFTGKSSYLDKCINIMFPKQILLKEIKRTKNEEDKKKIKGIYDDIFINNLSVKEICSKYELNTENNYLNVKTTSNLAYFNKRCFSVSMFVHDKILKLKDKYMVGQEVVCRQYYKVKGITLMTNYTYRVHDIDTKKRLVTVFDDVDDKLYTIPNAIFDKHFILPYCRTIDSSQGRSMSEKYTLFDCCLPYVSKEHFWVGLTRARDLNNVTVFINSDEEIAMYTELRIRQYYKFKIEGYKAQDDLKNRQYTDENFIDTKWIESRIVTKGLKCEMCCKDFEIFIDSDNNVNSNMTIDRLDNSKAHIKTNCQLACLICNVSKK